MKKWDFNLKQKKPDLPEPLGYSSRFNQEVSQTNLLIKLRSLKMKDNNNKM